MLQLQIDEMAEGEEEEDRRENLQRSHWNQKGS
jgi:hypothetical protein